MLSFQADDGVNMFLWNISSNRTPMVSHPRRYRARTRAYTHRYVYMLLWSLVRSHTNSKLLKRWLPWKTETIQVYHKKCYTMATWTLSLHTALYSSGVLWRVLGFWISEVCYINGNEMFPHESLNRMFIHQIDVKCLLVIILQYLIWTLYCQVPILHRTVYYLEMTIL
jgi:hypothetical protein